MNPPLTGSMGMRFFAPKATCAVCGREVDDDGAPVIAELGPSVDVSADGLHALADVTAGERLVICSGCAR